MVKFELITTQQLRPILDNIGAFAVQLLRNHINKQTEVHGGAFPPLAPSTIAAKRRKGGGVAGNATKRMKATNDFVTNAYEYKIDDNGVTIFISDKPHKALKTEAKKQARETNKLKGWNVSAKAPKHTNFSYRDLAGWQLRGAFDQKLRKSNNPGADFFGLSKSNEEKLTKMFVGGVKPIIEANLADAMRKCR